MKTSQQDKKFSRMDEKTKKRGNDGDGEGQARSKQTKSLTESNQIQGGGCDSTKSQGEKKADLDAAQDDEAKPAVDPEKEKVILSS